MERPQAGKNKQPELADSMDRSKALESELRAADVELVGSPLFNFTVPSA
jgi:FMN-dependent NADH-azoreductase